MEDNELEIVEMGGTEVEQQPPANNPHALDLRGLQWRNDCLELEFKTNISYRKSFKPKVPETRKREVIDMNGLVIEEEYQDPEEALRLKREAIYDKILRQNDPEQKPEEKVPQENKKNEEFKLLQNLDDACGVIPNKEPFDCLICFSPIEIGEGVVLRNCLHNFCRDCLGDTINFCEAAQVKCPFSDGSYSCDSILQVNALKSKKLQIDLQCHLLLVPRSSSSSS